MYACRWFGVPVDHRYVAFAGQADGEMAMLCIAW
jgi:hypothetical protein